MLALRKTGPEPGLVLAQVPEPPSPGPGELCLRVTAAGICGTDLHIADWTPGYEAMAAAMPVTLGHEFAGEVVAVGAGVDDRSVGDRVVVRPSTVCASCITCGINRHEICSKRRGLGVVRDGGFAGLVLVPAENTLLLPSELDLELAALTEPMTVSAEAVANGAVKAGDRVLVIGPGTIGQGVALLARFAGASEVIVAGREDLPRLTLLAKLGLTVLEVGNGAIGAALEARGIPAGFDVVIEAAGVPALIDPALGLLRPRGILVVCGIHPAAAAINLTQLVRGQNQIRGSYRAPLATWTQVMNLMAENATIFRQLITHRLPLSQALDGFALAKSRVASKVLLLP
ncbi:MAG: zinc-dependent alcohol dehydrogenase [Bosea sp. (in: a-proteobacteria)]